MSEQPQEPWDAEKHHPSCSPYDRDLVWHCSQCGANESAEAWHNAALAAEREKHREELRAEIHERDRGWCNYKELQQQLAAERETAARDVTNATQEIIRLSEQLSAEQEKTKNWKQQALDNEKELKALLRSQRYKV